MVPNSILIGAGFIGVGILLIVLGFRKNKRCSGRTVGRITGVREYQETDDDGYNYYSYSPEFEYEVNGQIYHGTGGQTYNKAKKYKSAVILLCITIRKNQMRISPKAVERGS